jgi:hypothetical protein
MNQINQAIIIILIIIIKSMAVNFLELFIEYKLLNQANS